MQLFEPYEVEIKTGMSKDELLSRLSQRGRVQGDKFFIESEPYSPVPKSTVQGEVIDAANWTLISFKIYPSIFFKVLAYLWLGGVGLIWLKFVITAIANFIYDPTIHWIMVFWIVGFLISHLSFRTSADIQEAAIRQIIRNKN